MKTPKEIYIGTYKVEFHRVKKDYLVYLQSKSICKRSSFTKMPKIGIISADLDVEKNMISLYKRVAIKGANKSGFELLKEFTPTVIDYERTTFNRIYYKTQKYLHKDILLQKDEIEVYFEDGFSKCNGKQLVDFLFNEIELDNFTPFKQKVNKVVSLLNVPDEKLTGEQLVDKMREEIANGLCPF